MLLVYLAAAVAIIIIVVELGKRHTNKIHREQQHQQAEACCNCTNNAQNDDNNNQPLNWRDGQADLFIFLSFKTMRLCIRQHSCVLHMWLCVHGAWYARVRTRPSIGDNLIYFNDVPNANGPNVRVRIAPNTHIHSGILSIHCQMPFIFREQNLERFSRIYWPK